MAANDPKQAIIEYIELPQGVRFPQPPASGSGGPIVIKPEQGALAGAVRFLHEQHVPNRQIHAIAFVHETGRELHYFCHVVQDEQGEWQIRGVSLYSTHPRGYPEHPQPGVVLIGQGQQGQFWSGGLVLNNGLDITRVRLLSKNGQILEDQVQNGLVLFISNQKMQMPIQAELYDRAGKLVSSHPGFQ